MKSTHFKIIELPTHQVLLTKDFDSEDDCNPVLVITIFFGSVKASHKLGFQDDKQLEDAFNGFDEELAQVFIDNTIEMFASKNKSN
jgi:hypothetical protein